MVQKLLIIEPLQDHNISIYYLSRIIVALQFHRISRLFAVERMVLGKVRYGLKQSKI